MVKMPDGTGSLKYEISQNKPFHSLRHEAMLGLLKTTELVRRVITSIVEPAGITMQQYNVLRILRGAGSDSLPTLEIRSRMIEQTPGITRLLDTLQKGGWVRRERCKDDRRQVLCSITDKGLKLLSELDAAIDAAPQTLIGKVPDHEVKVLVSALDKIRASGADGKKAQVDTGSAA